MPENKKFIDILKLSVLVDNLSNLNTDYWVKKCYKVQNQHPHSVYISNKNGYQSPQNVVLDSDFFPLIKIIQEYYYTNISLNPTKKIGALWINISPYKAYNLIHTHTQDPLDTEISGVLYLKTPKEGGDIVFYNPLSPSKSESLSPSPRDIIFFPSVLPHSVNPNFSQEDRISIAFNFN